MPHETVTFSLPFAALMDAVEKLKPRSKRMLWKKLNEQMEQEDDRMEETPRVKKEVAEARKAYQQGDYITLDDLKRKVNLI